MDMNIQKYMAFVKTVEYGSFTKAAEILNYSQSGISRMINDLEKEWKVVLLERGKSGVKLTSDGMKLLPYAKNVCMEYEKLQMEVDELNGLQSGLIRIGTFSSVATHWLPNIIKEFQKTYPGIDYELLLGDYTEIEEWISEGRVDCGFLRLPTCSDFVPGTDGTGSCSLCRPTGSAESASRSWLQDVGEHRTVSNTEHDRAEFTRNLGSCSIYRQDHLRQNELQQDSKRL